MIVYTVSKVCESYTITVHLNMTILRQIEKDKTGKEKKQNGNPDIRLKLTDFTNKK